jgi:hypothetical protein
MTQKRDKSRLQEKRNWHERYRIPPMWPFRVLLIVTLFIPTNGEFEFLTWVEAAVECREVKHEISCKARAIERRRVSNMKILVPVLVPDDADHPSIE